MENKSSDEIRVAALSHVKDVDKMLERVRTINRAFSIFMVIPAILMFERLGVMGFVICWLVTRIMHSLSIMLFETAMRSQRLAMWHAGVKRFVVVQAAKSSHTIVEYADGTKSQDLDPEAARAMERLGYGKIFRLPHTLRLPMRCSVARGSAFLHCRLELRLIPPKGTELAEVADYLWTQKESFDLKEELATCSRRAIQRHMQGCESKKRFDLTSHALNLKPPIELVTPLPYTLAVSGVRVEIVRGDKGTQTRR